MNRIAISLAALGVTAAPGVALAAEQGHLILESRVRIESVDQDGFTQGSDALTLRTRIGYETASFDGFRLLGELENVTALGEHYNNSYDGKPFPVVPDPAGTEINRAQISWSGGAGDIVAGRQRIILGNARFIGNSGFRQNEQTFDAVKAVFRPAKGLTLTYAYIGAVRRVFGHDSPQGVWRGDSHIFQADAKTPLGALSAYSYLLEFDNAAAQSSATWGARLTGARPIGGGLTATYEAEYARQSHYRNNPASFGLNYVAISAGLKTASSAASVGYERLDGNGARGFATPLATLHAFQGWADVFLTTPANGVRDANFRASTTIKPLGPFKSVRLQLAAHDFAATVGGRHYGRELDVAIAVPLTPHLSADLTAARFEGDAPGFSSRTKVWASLEMKY
jgi:hypothetical protein